MRDDHADRALRARIAAHKSWGQTADRAARTEAARRASHDRFLAQVPDTITDPAERAKAAANLRQAFYLEMARKSAAVRRRNKAGS